MTDTGKDTGKGGDRHSERRRLVRLLPGRPKRLGLGVLPNLVTVAAMLCGFSAIVKVLAGDLAGASLLILLAAILDGLDGKIARMAGVESEIGGQYDSLADMVSFGVAPATIFYSWAAPYAAAPAMICSCIFLGCVGLRLARFNLGGQEQAGPFYRGVPTVAAGCALAGYVWMLSQYGTANWPISIPVGAGCLGALLLSGLMVSNIKYYKFQQVRSSGDQSDNFLFFIMAALVFGLLFYNTSVATFVLATGYILSGLVRPLYGKLGNRLRKLDKAASAAENDSQTDQSRAGRKRA